MQGGIGGDHAVVGLARCGVKRQIVKLVGKGLARGPTEGNTQAVIPDNGEFEPLAIFTDPVQGPPFGPGDGLGRQQDFSSSRSRLRSLEREAPISFSCSRRRNKSSDVSMTASIT